MAKSFTYINFALLLLLGGICVSQWSHEKTYGDRVTDLQHTADSQQNKLLEQTEELRRVNEDVADFKQSVTALKTQTDEQVVTIKNQKAKIFTLEGEKGRLDKELTVWQHSVQEHKAALVVRDQNIQTLLEQREKILAANKDASDKANQAIVAYNDLTTKYEDVVTKYNTLATQYKSERDAQAAQAKAN